MALATTLLPGEPGGALATLLSQGVSALNQAVMNAINVGRDRATTQLNQENTIFSVLKNQRDLDMRKAENLRRNFETDRLFGRTVARDVREDFTKDRDFYRDVFTQDRAHSLDVTAEKRAADSAKRTAEHYTTTEQQAGQRLELDAQTRGANLLRMHEEQKQTDLLRSREEDLSSRAIGSTTADALSSPQAASTLTTPDLENYVDIFGPSRAPEVQGRVAVARRELSRRNPDVDPETGKKIPEKHAPDRTNPYMDKTSPTEIAAVTQNLKDQISDLDELIDIAKTKGKTNTGIASLINARRMLIEQLNKGPDASLATPEVAPGTTVPAKYFE